MTLSLQNESLIKEGELVFKTFASKNHVAKGGFVGLTPSLKHHPGVKKCILVRLLAFLCDNFRELTNFE